jgi:hypothetical protein
MNGQTLAESAAMRSSDTSTSRCAIFWDASAFWDRRVCSSSDSGSATSPSSTSMAAAARTSSATVTTTPVDWRTHEHPSSYAAATSPSPLAARASPLLSPAHEPISQYSRGYPDGDTCLLVLTSMRVWRTESSEVVLWCEDWRLESCVRSGLVVDTAMASARLLVLWARHQHHLSAETLQTQAW